MRPVLHDKTKKIYIMIQNITNATNSNDGQKMVLYSNIDGDLFVREEKEFWGKFSPIDASDICYTKEFYPGTGE